MPKIQQPIIVNQKKSNFLELQSTDNQKQPFCATIIPSRFFYKMNPPIIQNIFDKKRTRFKTAPLRFCANAHYFLALAFSALFRAA